MVQRFESQPRGDVSLHRITDIKTLHDGWGRFHLLTITRDDGETFTRQVEDHGAACCVLPYDPQRRVVTLVRQPRAAPLLIGEDDLILEVPAGLTDGEDPAEAAKREVMEETGLNLADLEPAGMLWSSPGCATERMHCYLAAYAEADRIGNGGGVDDEHEEIEVVELSALKAAAMLGDGRISDMKTAYLIQTLQLRHPELFAR
jgi:nudix-type nucleoside diphosphatase (YffH/AdpP family)